MNCISIKLLFKKKDNRKLLEGCFNHSGCCGRQRGSSRQLEGYSKGQARGNGDLALTGHFAMEISEEARLGCILKSEFDDELDSRDRRER